MKKLTFSSMAAARLRSNRRAYASLMVGIFLSIFLISTFVVGVYGIFLAQRQKRYDKVGVADMVVLDNDLLTDQKLMELGDFDRLGHAYITGCVEANNLYLGYYDQTAAELLLLSPVEGRMPDAPGEIAVEASVLEVLEADWAIGDRVELPIIPVDGESEMRSFTLVGILPERSVHLEWSAHFNLNHFPAILTSPDEPAFSTGRIARHFVLGLKEGVFLGDAVSHYWERYLRPELATAMYGLSISGEQVQTYSTGEMAYVEEEMMTLIEMAVALAAALMLSCGVGICGAMEGVLVKRREEIGVLRALGATRRQIRRMFGRENLLIALVVSPIAMAAGCGAVWVLSQMMPKLVRFGVSLWLLIPIGVGSIGMIVVSGYLPLVRASRLMPMSVIRDTRMLRRSKGVKSKAIFSAPKLISARQLQFHPTRQIGASVLVAMMLLSSTLLVGIFGGYSSYTMENAPGFILRTDGYYDGNRIPTYHAEPMSAQSIRQLRTLEGVESIQVDRELKVLVELPNVPSYAKLHSIDDQSWMLDDEGFREAMDALHQDTSFAEEYYPTQRQEYLDFLEEYGFEGQAFQTVIITVEPEQLEKLKATMSEGAIDRSALDSGTEVLVYAPEIWVKNHEWGSYSMHTSRESYDADPYEGELGITATNDSFYAGQMLPITQLYRTENDGPVTRQDLTVRVGGIVKELDVEGFNLWSLTAVITTEKGLESMGLRPEGLQSINVYLDGETSLEQEQKLEKQLTAIARRTEGMSVYNYMAHMRETQKENLQQILVFLCVITAFFATASGMIVSSVTRQLSSEGRTIGMLRAVGADERAIIRCWCGQLNAAISGGLAITGAMLLLYLGLFILDHHNNPYPMFTAERFVQWAVLLAVALGLAGLCWLLCRVVLGLRIREIVNRSIIDNIREL